MIKFLKTNNKNNFYKEEIELSQLANLYETDKGTANSLSLSWGYDFPNHKCMHYTNTYEKYMSPKKQNATIQARPKVCLKKNGALSATPTEDNKKRDLLGSLLEIQMCVRHNIPIRIQRMASES